MGVDPEEKQSAEPAGSGGLRSAPGTRQGGGPQGRRPEDDLLGFKSRLFMGVLFAALYIGTFLPRQSDLAAIVSGVLGGAVVFLLLKEVDERRKRRMRRGAPPPVRRKHRR